MFFAAVNLHTEGEITEMKHFYEWLDEALTPLENGAPPYTELRGIGWQYDENGIHTMSGALPENADDSKIMGTFDPQAETLAIIVPNRLTRYYSESAIKNYVDSTVLPDLQKKFAFRRHFIYR